MSFQTEWDTLAKEVRKTARLKGWRVEIYTPVEQAIALMHSELSEALEADRSGNPPSEHIPPFSGIEEEMADLIIQVMHNAAVRGWRIPEAIITKMQFNRTREKRHGGKRY